MVLPPDTAISIFEKHEEDKVLHRKLTEKQKAFAKALVMNGGNRTAAAIDAGYSAGWARMQAYELMKLPHVIDEVIREAALRQISNPVAALHFLEDLVSVRSEQIALVTAQAILGHVGFRGARGRSKVSATGKGEGGEKTHVRPRQ
jgi:phage terminase small subunit